ncbi:caspase-1-like [Prorops nasuta]|uniref:caspase-1-like n=1 Tax=Prorops nasuta TaxID=863751 RepID=UPI0034CD0870
MAQRRSTEQLRSTEKIGMISPDEGCFSAASGSAESLRSDRTRTRYNDERDTTKTGSAEEKERVFPPEQKTAKMPVCKDSEVYNMNHKYRGKCIVFNHENFDDHAPKREGTHKDAERIKETFQKLEFTVVVHDDLYLDDIRDKIKKQSENMLNNLSSTRKSEYFLYTVSEEDHTDNDCVCIFVLTHGSRYNVLKSRDGLFYIEDIWKPFTADNCQSLAGKPKIIFIQACKGERLDGGIKMQARSASFTVTDGSVSDYKIPTHTDFLFGFSTVEALAYTIPTHSDFLIAHSTIEEFYSWRNPVEGTWYIQCLCNVLEEHYLTKDLIKMLTITNRKVATEYASYNTSDMREHDQKQASFYQSMLIRDLYFLPKTDTQ